MKTKRRYKGISRIDQPAKRTHGWYVRVAFKNKQFTKFFADEKNGGYDKALAKAMQFRDKVEKKLGKPSTDRPVVMRSSRNRTGIIGVRKRITRTKTKSGKIKLHKAYEITWSPEPNVIRRTSISIDAHGEEKAFWKAYRLRRAKEREIYGKAVQNDKAS
ncbi:MAG: AP2 domain-containing protein [Acidobacteriota bacterium]